MKTIDINAKEWFDKINGNSYFSAVIIIDFGTTDSLTINMPFQYGYENHYIEMAAKELEKYSIITDLQHYENGGSQALWSYCQEKNIILRTNKQAGCKKRDL